MERAWRAIKLMIKNYDEADILHVMMFAKVENFKYPLFS